MLNVIGDPASIGEQLALDATLLEMAESGNGPGGLFRTWELSRPTVIVGRSSRIEDEVDLAECRAQGVELARRDSGGCAVVSGPGCLMYSVLLSYQQHPELRALDRAHEFVLRHVITALESEVRGIAREGTSDLVLEDRKFSGNSMRCCRDHVLYHGTVLYDFRLELISKCLRMPSRQPEYRSGRAHDEFVMNLAMDGAAIRSALVRAWGAEESYEDWPAARVAELTSERFANAAWTHRR